MGGTGSRCGSDQRAVMREACGRRAAVSTWPIGPCGGILGFHVQLVALTPAVRLSPAESGSVSTLFCVDQHDHGGPPIQASDWDDRYRRHTHRTSGDQPNEVLVTEIGGQTPGRALEVGCGEGTDATWLAANGWRVTATDISQVALDHAAAAADERGVSVDWVCGVFGDTPVEPDAYDLVVALYPALQHGPTTARSSRPSSVPSHPGARSSSSGTRHETLSIHGRKASTQRNTSSPRMWLLGWATVGKSSWMRRERERKLRRTVRPMRSTRS